MNMLEDTLAFVNANVTTLGNEKLKAEAIAVRDGKIVAVGSNEEIRRHLGKTSNVVDVRGRTIVPGFVDCHAHMVSLGRSNLDLRNVGSIREMRYKLREYADENVAGDWILGGRWDQERFAERRYPTRWDLDAAISKRPVFLVRVCGHVAVTNSKALQLAGIEEGTTVAGGQVDLDEKTGQPTGVVRENALKLLWRVVPKPSLKIIEDMCVSACQKAVKAGLTGVHWLVGSGDEVRVLQKLNSEGKLPLRIYLGVPVELLDELVRLGLVTGFGNDLVKVGFVKIFSDGSLGAHTAALREPYSDSPETNGMLLYTQRKLDQLVLKAHRAGLQLGVHAIGDRAVESVLKAFDKALKEFPRKNHRHRIEHCSILNPRLVERMKCLGLVASVQPHFVVSDFWTANRVGQERASYAYPFKTLMRSELVVASGSDCPVEKIDPLLGVWAAVTRKNPAEERLTVEEALRTYTLNAAYASFDEDKKGTIEVGKLADFTVLSDDLLRIQPDKIKGVTVEMTVVGGRIVYASKSFDNTML